GVFVMPEERITETTRLLAFAIAPGVSRETVLAALRQRIDAAFMPRPLYLVDALPRNSVGKLPREALRQLAMELGAEIGGKAEIVRQFPTNHPTSAGHFPGNPIIPGAVLLDEVLRAVAHQYKSATDCCVIRQVKFLRPVRPGDRLVIRWAAKKE